jgi:8-oxo-dGTP diphosphatase
MRNEKGETLEEFLAGYDVGKYPRPSVTADIAVFTAVEGRLAVLLVKRRDHPFIGTWAMPGGFVNVEEEIEQAAARELMEETGVSCEMFQLGAYGGVHRDPRTRVITVAHIALMPEGSVCPKAGDDAADAALFTLEEYVAKPHEAGVRHSLTLKHGEKLLFVCVLVREESKGLGMSRTLLTGDLASDHSLILFDALCRLRTLPKEAVLARLLGRTNGEKRAALAEDIWRTI